MRDILDIEAIKARLVEFVRRFTGDVALLSAETAADIAALLAEVEALRARCERLAALARTLNTPQQWASAAAARSGVTFTPMAAADVAAAMAALHPGDTEEAK